MINRRGISSVITVALITLGAVIGTALLWTFISKNIDNASSEVVHPDCLTINLEALNCKTYGACSYIFGEGYYEADVLVKRSAGQGNVTGLRFISESSNGFKTTYDRDLADIGLRELQSFYFTEPYDAIPLQRGSPPYTLSVVALIGEKKDVCPITSNKISCPVSGQFPPLGRYANNTSPMSSVSSNRIGNCCQYPANSSVCYNGADLNYPFNSNYNLVNGLPPGNSTVCCQANPR